MAETVSNRNPSIDDEAAKAVYLKMTEYFKTSNAMSIDDAESQLVSVAEGVCEKNVSVLEARRLYAKGKNLCL